MTSQDKRSPALDDLDLMPFGVHKDKPMQDVPPRYLLRLHEQDCSDIRVANYIHNSMDAIRMEVGE